MMYLDINRNIIILTITSSHDRNAFSLIV